MPDYVDLTSPTPVKPLIYFQLIINANVVGLTQDSTQSLKMTLNDAIYKEAELGWLATCSAQ